MVLRDEVITKPRHFRNETFHGMTTLRVSAHSWNDLSFTRCVFDREAAHVKGAVYALYVPIGFRPRAVVSGCSLLNAQKLVLGQWLAFNSKCQFKGAPDGIWGRYQDGPVMHVEDCDFDLDTYFGEHGDCVQLGGGKYLTVKGNRMRIRGPGANSCVFLEAKWAPCVRCIVAGNSFYGGGFHVWSYEDPNSRPGPNRDIRVVANASVDAHGELSREGSWEYGPVTWTPGSEPYQAGNSWNYAGAAPLAEPAGDDPPEPDVPEAAPAEDPRP